MYRDAYKEQYKSGNIEKAKKIYEEIIEGYPVSDAADYSAIQLKIILEKVDDSVKEVEASIKQSPVPLVVSIVTLAVTIAILIFGLLHISKTEAELKNMSDLSLAQNKIMIGSFDEALLILSELKIKNENNIMPFLLASDIYADRNDYKAARHELKAFKRLNPGNHDIDSYLQKLKLREVDFIKKQKKEITNSGKIVKKSSPKKYREKEPTVRKVKREDISYF